MGPNALTNVLRFVKDSIGLTVLFAALIALLTQLQIRKVIPAIFGIENPVLVRWHRWAGRITVGGFVLYSMVCPLVGVYPAFPFAPQYVAHSVPIALCAAAVLSKVWVTRCKVWGTRRLLTWWATALLFGAGFFTLSCALAAWRWANPTVTWDTTKWLIYRAATLGHVGMAVALIWLGRLATTNRRDSDRKVLHKVQDPHSQSGG